MAGPLSLGVAIPGLVSFSMSPLTGVQVRLLDALAPRPQTMPQATVQAAQSASTAQFSAPAATAALSQQLSQRLEQLYQANPSLPRLPLRSLQVSYGADGKPKVTLGPMAGPLPSGTREQMQQLLAGNEQVLARFLQDNDALLRQVAAANGGTVNLALAGTPAAAAAPAGLAVAYGPYSLSTGYGTLAAATQAQQ